MRSRSGEQLITGRAEGSALRLIERLERLDALLADQFQRVRKHERIRAHGQLRVFVPAPGAKPTDLKNAQVIHVWTRNLSQGGLSFIAREQILAEQIVVELPFADGRINYLLSNVVRTRQVDEEFWEYGVAFLLRLGTKGAGQENQLNDQDSQTLQPESQAETNAQSETQHQTEKQAETETKAESESELKEASNTPTENSEETPKEATTP